MSLLAFCGYDKRHDEKELRVERVDLISGSHSPSSEEAKIATQAGKEPGARTEAESV